MKYPTVRLDSTAKAARIAFKDIAPGETPRSIPVDDKNGDTIAVVNLSSQGKILGIEILDIENRLPEEFIDQYRD